MAEHEANTHHLAPGQKPGDPHPENPFSEEKYPMFFRLFNRGDREETAPLDVDEDYYVVKNFDKFEARAKAMEGALIQERLQFAQKAASETTTTIFKETKNQKYNVFDEAVADAFSRDMLSKCMVFAQEAARHHGLKELSDADDATLTNLYDQYNRATEAKDTKKAEQLAEQYDTVRRGGVSKEVYQQYEQEVFNFAKRLAPHTRKCEIAIAPEIFQTIEGGDVRMGGWYDSDLFPDTWKNSWVKNGLSVQVPTAMLKNITLETIFGRKVGRALDAFSVQGFEQAVRYRKKKYGARLAIGVYCGIGLWTVIGKWTQINFREMHRQKLKTAHRISQNEVPLTPTQVAIAKKHLEWSKNYYEEEE